jgi:hypothetical protein
MFGDNQSIEECLNMERLEFTFSIDNIRVEFQFYARGGNVTLEPCIVTGED